MWIHIDDREIRVSQPDGTVQKATLLAARWPQFRIADRLSHALPPRIAPDRKGAPFSLGWVPCAHLTKLLGQAFIGPESAR